MKLLGAMRCAYCTLRVLHHAETVLIDGKSYRMKDQVEKDQVET